MHKIFLQASLKCMYLATALTTTDCIVYTAKKSMHELSFSFVLLCFISFCLCLYNACDNPTLLEDTPPSRLSYGKISNHCRQITSARRTWKIYVLGRGSCMTIRDFEIWGMLPVWYGTCFSPPVLLSWRSEPPLVSCPAGMLAKLIGLLQIRQRHCSRNISPFSLPRSPGSLEGIEALRTQHKPHFLHCLASTSDFAPFQPSCLIKVTCPFSSKCETFFLNSF